MKYLITDTGIIRISEVSGVIQNTSQSDSVELSDSENFTNVFILYPLNIIKFTKQLYIRGYGKIEQPIELNVADFVDSASGGSTDTGTTTDDDVENYLDDVLNGADTGYNNTDTNNYLDDLLDGGNDNYDNSDVDDYLNGLMAG